MNSKITASLALLLVLALTAADAGRPLTIDDAAAAAAGSIEAEAGVRLHRDGTTGHCDLPMNIAYGVTSALELDLGFGGQLEQRKEALGCTSKVSSLADLTLGVKWNPISQPGVWAIQSLAFTLKLPTADCDCGLGTGRVDADLTYIATRTLSERADIHFNAGYTWTGDGVRESIDDILHTGIAVGYAASDRMDLVAEAFANIPLTEAANSGVSAAAGVRWSAIDRVILDAAAGGRLRGSAPDWFFIVGVTWSIEASRTMQSN